MKHTNSILAACCLIALSAANAREKTTEPDNTDRNKRDNSGAHKTATDQSNNPDDIKLVANIRRMVVQDDSLSSTAKNCKIITAGGLVTLRGPVNSAQEKSVVEKHALMSAGKGKVDNQLEIKASK